MKPVYFLLILAAFSCNSANRIKEQFLKHVQKGVIIENVECKDFAQQSYALYLPTNYDISKPLPIIYAFDSHGNGSLPLSLMKKTAEELGYILVGSNNSKNGLSSEELNSIIQSLLSDTKTKLAIDTSRIYTIGFSGGSRVASMVAQTTDQVKAVIGCSAGFDPSKVKTPFSFIGIAGLEDMNYLEMAYLHKKLDLIHTPNSFLVSYNKHQWPSEAIISHAISLLQLYAIKSGEAPANKPFVEAFKQTNTKYIAKLKATNHPDSIVKAYFINQELVNVLDGLTPIVELKADLIALQKDAPIQSYLNLQSALETEESKQQQELQEAYESKNEAWWNSKIKALTTAWKEEKTTQKRYMAKRLLGYISLSCYGYVSGALQNHNWQAASLYANIYQQADPENSETYYDLACLQANTGKPDEAIASLKLAVKYGFKDKHRLENDGLLMGLHSHVLFNGVLNN